MFVLLAAALLLMVCGSTFLQGILDPREHPVSFILYWMLCAWITLTAILLAIFDLLMTRAEARKARRSLANNIESGSGDLRRE